MKIVAMIGGMQPPLIYFANRLHREFGLELLVLEEAPEKPVNTPQPLQPGVSFPIRMLRYLLFRLELMRGKKGLQVSALAEQTACNEWFGDDWKKLDDGIRVLHTKSVNAPEVSATLETLKPDLLLDHGTTLVSGEIIQKAPLALNLHWGLSPWYRGVESTLHALLNQDPYNIGVTIHKLAVKIDGGDILGQARAVIRATDTVTTIPFQLTRLGTDIMVNAIRDMKQGIQPGFHVGTDDYGFLFRNIHWNTDTHHFGRHISPAQLETMLKYPSRTAMPIVEYGAK